MATDEVLERLHRIYAAVDAVEEGDIAKFAPTIFNDGRIVGIYQNFLGGLTSAELSNLAYSVIHNLANLRDHLCRWAENNGHDSHRIDQAVSNSPALQIIKDLSNNDKHGYPLRHSHSGKHPKLVDVNRVLRLTTAPQAGSRVVVTLTHEGLKQVAGTGSTKVIITGQIIDSNGTVIGDLYEIELKGLDAWEEVLQELGIH